MKSLNDLIIKFKNISGEDNVFIDEPMKNHSYFKVGGPADVLVAPKSMDEAIALVNECRNSGVTYYVIGNGSNLLIRDGGIRGVVIKLTNLDKITVDGTRITADCGAQLCDISKKALEKDLHGIEFACGIPGSVGGAVFMNAGAYDSEMSRIVESAVVLDDKGNIRTLNNAELELGYRTSVVMQHGYFVLSVTVALENGSHEKIKARIDELTRRRTEKQPLEYPSAGSTFKRPEGYFAGKLIQDCGLKGFSIGGAAVSKKHSGFIINKGGATAKDILAVIKHVQDTVKEQYGVDLHTEVRIIGEE